MIRPSSTAIFLSSDISLLSLAVVFSSLPSATIVIWSKIITLQSLAFDKYLILSINRSMSSKSKPSNRSSLLPALHSSNHFFKSAGSCAFHTSGLRKFLPASKDIKDIAVSSATSSKKNAPILKSVVFSMCCIIVFKNNDLP